jgi:hypothetical protein
MKNYYLVISAALATEAQGYTKGENSFRPRQLPDGRWVCAHRSLQEFPELFVGRHVVGVELELEDFRPPAVLNAPA